MTIRVLYHLMRADFLERVRRYSFLITLGFALYAAYMFLPPNGAKYVTLTFDGHRGIYNSAWVGSLVAMMSAIFVSLAGFYVIKNAIARDRETGVGEIIATTPVRSTHYLLGKFLSNFAVLAAMVMVLAIGAVAMQLLRAEETRIDLWALWAPLFFVTLPVTALVAAIAVVFETVPVLRGGGGNVLYYFVWLIALSTTITDSGDVFGHRAIQDNMAVACATAFPDFDLAERHMSMGFNIAGEGEVKTMSTYVWGGIDWTPGLVISRLRWYLVALAFTLLGAIPFDRFDTMRPALGKRRRRRKGPIQEIPVEGMGSGELEPAQTTPEIRLPPALAARVDSSRFLTVLFAELKLLLKGRPWPWYMVSLGLIIGGIFAPSSIGRLYLLPISWVWPVLVWSGMGARELRARTDQIVFACPHPVRRQLPATWLAGMLVALLAGVGVLLRLLIGGEWTAILALVIGAGFIPAMSLAMGIWTRSGKMFEILYLLLWYGGPMNQVPFLDYLGATDGALQMGIHWWFLAATVGFLGLATVGRLRALGR